MKKKESILMTDSHTYWSR